MDRILDLSIIIVSFNTKGLTRRCLEKISHIENEINYEVIVVDNGSNDGSADMISLEFPWVKLIRLEKNRGFAGGNVPGMRRAKGRYILLLNSDAFISKGILKRTVSYMDQHPRIGILGCKLVNEDGSLQPSARMLPSPFNKVLHITGLAARFHESRFFGRLDFSWWDHSEPRSVGWVVGAYFLIRRETMKEIGPLDDRYFLYFEEIDYCLSARRAGWDVVFYPYAEVIHLGGQSAIKNHDERITPVGKQILKIKFSSEYKYYRKLYGWCHTLAAAGIEISWNVLILIKNLVSRKKDASIKANEAAYKLRLMISIMWKERLGARY